MSIPFMYMGEVSSLVLMIIYFPACFCMLLIINRILKKSSASLFLRRLSLSVFFLMMFFYATWDAILGKYYLDKLCEKDGGTYINRPIPIDGIYFADNPRRDIAESFLRRGFLFIEMGKPGDYVRYSMKDDNSLMESQIDNLLSKGIIYYERKITREIPSYINITVDNQFLEHIKTKERLGGFRNYTMTTRLDRKLRGVGGIKAAGCTTIPKFTKQDRFTSQTQYLNILAGNED